jgi:TRAP-type uncharacterized transport system substrate-binding protein
MTCPETPSAPRRLGHRLLPALLATVMLPAVAQSSLVVSTGVARGTYSALWRDLTEVCQDRVGVPMVEKTGSGAGESLDRLLANEVSAAFVQTDLLHARATTEDLSRIRTLVPLHAEPVHILARSAPLREGGVLGLGQRDVVLRSLADLGGRRVGVWGGAVITATLIRLQAEVDYRMVEFSGPDEALQALRAQQVEAVIAVGGAPLAWLRGLDRSVQLLPVPEALVTRLRNVYRPARLSYANLGAQGLPTVATEAVLAVRDVRATPAVAPLLRLRQCLTEQIDTLRDTTGRHAAWAQVEPQATSHWPRFERTASGGATR